MNITRDPIFKSIMFALAVIYLALVTQTVWAAKPVKISTGPTTLTAGHAVFTDPVSTVD